MSMTESRAATLLGFVLVLALLAVSMDATAATDADFSDRIIRLYEEAARNWGARIVGYASRLFWTLAAISLVWTFGFMALRKADLGEFFAEFIRFTLFTGFFWWLLTNAAPGPGSLNIAGTIIRSMQDMGTSVTGTGALNPTNIFTSGLNVFTDAVAHSDVWQPITSAVIILMGLAVAVILGLVGANMILMLCSSWILLYAGVFFLGFGGSRWTSDLAVNYYKTVLGIGASLFAMILLVGVGTTFLQTYFVQVRGGGVSFENLGVLILACVILLYLVNKVPGLISGIISGASIGHAGIGNFGAGAAMGAAGMAMAAASLGGSMLARGAVETAGGVSALRAAYLSGEKNAAATPPGPGPGPDDTPKLPDSGKTGGGGATAGKGGGSGTQVLMQGARAVLSEKARSVGRQWNDAVADSFGGKVAAAIKESRKPADSDKEKDAGGSGGKTRDAGQSAGSGPSSKSSAGAAQTPGGGTDGGAGQGAQAGPQAGPVFSDDGLGAGREGGSMDAASGRDAGAGSTTAAAGAGAGRPADAGPGAGSADTAQAASAAGGNGPAQPAGAASRQAPAGPSGSGQAGSQAKEQDAGKGTASRQPFSLWAGSEFGAPGAGDWDAVIAEFARPRE